jgi:hypothetical protein
MGSLRKASYKQKLKVPMENEITREVAMAAIVDGGSAVSS